jgi:hypothetical protein
MKLTTLISSIISLLAAGTGMARNPRPLKFRCSVQTLENPINRVVLVHGFLENGATFRTLRKRLEKQIIQCLVPKMLPSDGRGASLHSRHAKMRFAMIVPFFKRLRLPHSKRSGE